MNHGWIFRMAGLAALIVTLLLGGCLQSAPDERMLRQLLDEKAQAESAGVLGVKTVKKLNAFEPDDRHYQVKLAVTYVVKKPLDEAVEALEKRPDDDPLTQFGQLMKMAALGLMIGDRKVGETFDEIEVWEFIRTEKGWRASRRLQDSSL